MRLYKLTAIFILILAGVASAQVGRTGVPFLLIAPGARAAGMGEAFISISDDATAMHWNPAGLGKYPLTGAWLNLKGNDNDTIASIVLVKNNLPENNYRQYDVWGLVNGKLATWDGRRWITSSKQELKVGSSLQSLILRYTGLSEEEAGPYVDRLARANNTLVPESIDSLKTALLPILPSDYVYKEEISYGFDKLHKAYLELRLNLNGFNQICSDVYSALQDQTPSTEKLDKIAFGFDRAISSKGDRSVMIPFDLILPDSIMTLGTDDEYVYIGTTRGMFRLEPDKLRWSSFSSKTDSLPSDRITTIQKVGRRTMYVGTDKGIVIFTGTGFKSFPRDSGAPSGLVRAIAAETDRNVWAASDADLYHYDGFKWSNAYDNEFTIGETLPKSVETFYGELGVARFAEIFDSVKQANPTMGDSLAAGQVVKLPYRFGYKGDITVLGLDQRNRLWIGTTAGIDYFDGERFHLFGYKLYQPPQAMTVQEIAAQFIPDRKPEKIERLSALIKKYNDLETDQVEAGEKLLVFANALGSEVNSIRPVSSKRTLVATNQALVEYKGGKWNRLHSADMKGSEVSSMYSRGGELWLGGRNKVSIFSAPKKQITFMHSNYLVQLANDIYYEYFSFAYPSAEWGTFGMAITFLSLGNQIRTGEIGEELGLFYTYEMAITLSYGTKLMNNVYGGVSLRYINSHLSDVGAGREKGSGVGYSVAIDGGIIYDMTRRLTLAATITNIGPDISYIDADQADPLPRKMAVGFNYKIVDSPFNKVSFVGEATKLLVDLNDDIKTEVEEIIPHLGLEYWYSNYVALRSGYVYDKIGVQRYFTLGASLQYSSYRFDFAYIPPSDESFNRLGNTIRFSMNVGF